MSFEEEAKALRKAMKGMGTDEKAIIKTLCKHSNAERQEIKQQYQQMYGKNLVDDIKSEVSGNFEKCLVAMLEPLAEFEAKPIRDAIKGLGTDEDALIKHLCARDTREIAEAYQKLYGSSLEEDVASDVSGDWGRIMRILAMGKREAASEPIDMNKAQNDANTLYEAGKGQLGTDEDEFIRILCTRSFPQLKATCECYAQLDDKGLKKRIKKEMSGKLEKCLVTIVKCAQNRPEYFAELLHDSMSGIGTKDEDLIRLIVTESERDMKAITSEYLKMYGKNLVHDVKKDCSGDYEKLLVALIEK